MITPERLAEIKRQAEALTYEPTRKTAFELLTEIERLNHHIDRAWVHLSCGYLHTAKRELEKAYTTPTGS